MHIAMLGTRGVPPRYGGFETCVNEVGRRLADNGHNVTVYCRASNTYEGESAPAEFLGMRLVHLPAIRRKALETLSHTALSVLHAAAAKPDVVLMFDAANAPLLPVLRMRRIPVATHVDGLEWKRAKWGRVGSRYYRAAESLSVRWSDAIIADARGIQDHFLERFQAATEYIPYGAPILDDPGADRLAELNLTRGEYHLVVARFEPENHIDLAVAGYRRSTAKHPLVIVGSAPYAGAYTKLVHELAASDPNVFFLGSVWDQQQLDQLYANALTYIHGHSVGGTNPSLLRAMGAGAATSAFDVNFNREVLGDYGRYWRDPDDIAELCVAAEADPSGTTQRGRDQLVRLEPYDWDKVADSYEQLARRLAARAVRPQHRRRGRRPQL